MKLGNINPRYRSKLTLVRLLAIAKTSQLSDCGVDGILGRLYDLQMLYGGNIQTDSNFQYGESVSTLSTL